MNKIYSVIPNYGIAIILLTLTTKILLWPLGTKSYKSMSEMKKLQPLMTEIRDKYKNDKQKMNQELMALYRTYKVNPFGRVPAHGPANTCFLCSLSHALPGDRTEARSIFFVDNRPVRARTTL
jgi:hypothetical protein